RDMPATERVLRRYDDLAVARGRSAHAVGVLAVAIRAADHAHQDAVACRRVRRQVVGQEEDALAGAAAHVDRGNPELFHGWHYTPDDYTFLTAISTRRGRRRTSGRARDCWGGQMRVLVVEGNDGLRQLEDQ